MVRYYLERLTQSIITLLAVVTLSFGMIRLMPGGPMEMMRARLVRQNPDLGMDRINRLAENYVGFQPDRPIHEQYIEYLTMLAQGDMGDSYEFGRPVTDILAEALPWTVFVMSLSLLLMFVIAIALGALMAYREGSRFDTSWTVTSVTLTSVPYYVAAILLVYVFGYQLGWLPTGGRVAHSAEAGLNGEFLVSAIRHAVLPVASFVITGFGALAVAMRGNSIQVLGEDYMRVARLRGLSERRISFRYVARNAILPMWTSFLIAIGAMFGGSVILEEIFSYPGVGYYMLQAIEMRDMPLMMGAFLVITIGIIIGVLIADLTYGMLDPRASRGDGAQ